MVEPVLFLYDPDEVRARLDELPALGAVLAAPELDGVESMAFANGRRSSRQIYRVLGNQHYPHLHRLLNVTNKVADAGYCPRQLTTRSADQFASTVSEILVADYLLRRGFALTPAGGAGRSAPEFVANHGPDQIAVEVYAPRGWDGLTELPHAIRSRIENADICLDFEFWIDLKQLDRFDPPTRRLLYVDPIALARRLDLRRRERVGATLADAIECQLLHGNDIAEATWTSSELNLDVSVRVEVDGATRTELPKRRGYISHLGLSGYAPEAIFDRLVGQRLRAKARRRQGRRSQLAPRSVLVVDLGLSDLTPHLGPGPYSERFLASLHRWFGREPDFGYDLIALGATSNADDFIVHFLVSETESSGLAETLFHPERAPGSVLSG